MKAAELSEKTVAELVELEKSLAGDFFKVRLKNFTNQLDDTSAIRKAKRDRARVLTVLAQRRAAAAAPVNEKATEAEPDKSKAPKPPKATKAKKSEAK